MNTKKIIFAVLSIFVVSAVSYFIISPVAKQELDKPFVEDVKINNTEEVKTLEVKTVETTPKPTVTPIAVIPKPSVEMTQEPVAPTPTPVQTEPSGISAQEVSMHSTESSCWSIVNGQVYDLTSYISKHPGGSKNILRICGKDGTSAFEGQHGGDSKPEKILAGYKIGTLK